MPRASWGAYFRSQARLCRFVAEGLNVPNDVQMLERMATRYERVARTAQQLSRSRRAS
jgi:hypothetical protein